MPPKRNIYEKYGIVGKNVEERKNELLNNLKLIPLKQTKEEMNRFTVSVPNSIHQADLLYLPNDEGNDYLLVVVDVATGKTDFEPLKERTAQATRTAIEKIYSRNILNFPTFQIQTDQGSEFGGVFNKLFADKGITHRKGRTARHRQQAMVEARNKIIGKIVFTAQQAKELQTGEPNTDWIYLLPSLRTDINEFYSHQPYVWDAKKSMLGKQDILDIGTKVRVVLERPVDLATDRPLPDARFRATDTRWENKIRTIERLIFQPNQEPMYIVSGIPHTAFPRKQIQVIRENEKMPDTSYLDNLKKKYDEEQQRNNPPPPPPPEPEPQPLPPRESGRAQRRAPVNYRKLVRTRIDE